MATTGIVVKFDKERGFGFVRIPGSEGDAFVHIRDVEGRVELVPGQQVTCDLVDTPKGPAAKNVKPGAIQSSPTSIFLLVAMVLIAAVMVPLRLYLSVPWLLGALAGINGATFLLYGYDKAIAGGKRLRVPEAVLQLLTLFGGTPAAFLGQAFFHHKTRKGSFQRLFWLIVLLQAALIGGWFWCRANQPPWIPEALRFLFSK
ncbi:MAG TPA: cold shock and DUF1294 domain-containing protein [Planctomycetota bacterium]|nr:cold shock and DUF1294 domain-containing protein [Planctomycetota bacterium]